MEVPLPPVPTIARRSFFPATFGFSTAFAATSDNGFNKAAPVIAPVAAKKCRRDILFITIIFNRIIYNLYFGRTHPSSSLHTMHLEEEDDRYDNP